MFWDQIPINGFGATFRNGDKTSPELIKLHTNLTQSENYSVISRIMTTIGKFIFKREDPTCEENFAAQLSAAFSWPPFNSTNKYMVYLFKKDKYCLRPDLLEKNKSCEE
jgi:hypothetical protein